MDCDTASGLMPWLLNRTLEAAEAEGLERHLAGCAACRADYEETRRAAAVFAAHLSAETVLDLAWDRDVPDAAVARRHLADCAACAEDLALARESRRAGEETEAPAAAPWRIARWVALPATLAAGLVIGLSLPRAPAPPVPPAAADPALARLEDENARLRASVSDLRAQAEAAAAPELNLPVFEVLSESLTRGPAGVSSELAVPKGARQVALLLVADVPAGTPAAFEIRGAAGEQVWRAEGLVPNALGAYSLAVPTAMLPEGAYRFVLQPRGSGRVEYRVRIRPAP